MSRTRVIKRILAFGAVLVAAAALVAVVVVWHAVKTSVDGSRARQGAALAKYHRAFLEDERFAATLPILAWRAGDRDASLVIAPRVGWIVIDPKTLESYRRALPEDARGLELDAGLVKKIDKDWLNVDPALWVGLDFTWMRRLADYDYWDLDRHNLAPSPPGYLYGASPDLEKLSAWAKLRLARGLHDGDPATAIREVEQLARLCTTTEETDVIAVGLSLLPLADKVRERAVSLQRGAGDLGKPLREGDWARLHRALWAAIAHAELRASAAYDGDWGEIAVGRCAALAWTMGMALPERPFLLDSYRAEYEHLGRLLAASPECRLPRLRKLWAQPDFPDIVASLEGTSWPMRAVIRWVPAVRTLFGEMLVAISEQDWFRNYHDGDASDAGPPVHQ